MAQDEGVFGRISEPVKCWAPAPIRPVAPRQIVREFVYVFAAVCPSLGRMTSLILPDADSEMMSIFLAQVSRDFSDYFIVMVLDKAGWHTTGKLDIPSNIRLLPLPARSPELNPAEHIWDDMREKDFGNVAFDNLSEVEDRICDSVRRLCSAPDGLRSLTDFPYMDITL